MSRQSVRPSVCATLLLSLLFLPLSVSAALDLKTWTDLLAEAVTDGAVDYSRWDKNARFDALVEQIATVDTGAMNRQQKLVFYINAYNILAAQGILDGNSPDGLLARYAYFKRDTYLVSGARITLHALEHELIRPLQEPRIHFAIVCASVSCPILQSEAYTLENLDQQLQAATTEFINDPRRNQFDRANASANLSSIFKWFEEDFVEAAGSLQAYLAPLVENEEVAALLEDEAFKIRYQRYDWSLNGTLSLP
ncbi:DUF547 domain-containing protein [Halieaceae bacterium IMCC14734]|uniref:DUF547 domain-containing protein n=1 Tax=Candidatus Litorirhabdus singularis TaxID=2518993 RepID=A0ABT3TET3_9GAMM|nr:DUF547 domain-containing protein [Candidatus Litorirhabdus singularis]MCX2980700.1 DUF547 domain-containing protein [Candidatus Litorirhabdus singularis]